VLCPPGYEQVRELVAGKAWLLRRRRDGAELVGKFYRVELQSAVLTALAHARQASGGESLVELIEHGPVPLQVNQVTRYFTVEPYAPHGTLRDLMKPDHPIREAVVRDALRAMAEGVHALHSAGLLHRDIEPANLLVAQPTPTLRLRWTGVEHMLQHSGLGAEPGLVENGYMAPERHAGRYDQAAEWWAVGLILYEALTGRHAYAIEGGINRSVNLQALAQGRPIEFDRVPEAWRPLLRGLLTRLPERRWGYGQVRLFLDGRPLPEPPPYDGPRPAPQAAPRADRPNGRLLAVQGELCATAADVARTCALQWPAAAEEVLRDRRLVDWLQECGKPDMAAQVDRLRHVASAEDADERSLDLMLLLDPAIQPNFGGLSIAPSDLQSLARRALAEPPTGTDGAPSCHRMEKLYRLGVLHRFRGQGNHGRRLAELGEGWRDDAARLHGRCARVGALTGGTAGLAHAHQLAYLLLARIDDAFLAQERKRLQPLSLALQRLSGSSPTAVAPQPVDLCALASFESVLAATVPTSR
jgi:hypothetical protein